MRGLLELSAARVAAHTIVKRAPVFVRVFTDITSELARLRQQLAGSREAAERTAADQAAGVLGADLLERAVLLGHVEPLEIGCGKQPPVGAEGPHVIGARELRALARRFLDELGAAVRADVVEGAHRSVLAAHDREVAAFAAAR